MKQYRKKPNFERTEGLHVIVRDNNVDKAMRKLKRMVKNAGILQEIQMAMMIRLITLPLLEGY